ncbi:hypothetical protein [Methylobacterium sp. Leaf94]|uniref:hypothetical protein n=1 Tax=Methylobacterium sp. Leaf94 TaxID=1736250 RepID=UPI000B13047F|nr:hypothetical protein [Methylobacterium sp. Leaf94]
MTASFDTHVIPRPVEALPDYAHSKARQTLADKLVEAFGLSPAASRAIADAVVNPTAVRKSIGDTREPEAERIAVSGGTLLGIRTYVWARKVMPDSRNPRILPARRHPFAVAPGTGSEDSKFRPIPEPRSPDYLSPTVAELRVDIESRHHLDWAAQLAAKYVLNANDWRDSIRLQGVMEAVTLVATTYHPADGTDPVTVPVTAEGSSRITADHSILGVRSGDVPYEDEGPVRGTVRRLNKALEAGAEPEDLVALRCERIPALILVGFEPFAGGTTTFPTAVRSYVALRHVDPPQPWGAGPENESLANEVMDELYRRNLITATQLAYYEGSITRAEAKAAHLSDDPAVRAAEIVGLFVNPDESYRTAIRVAVTSQSTRKRVNQRLLNDLAAALILRALADDPDKADQVRRYLRHAFGKAAHNQSWKPTDRGTDALVTAALEEARRNIAEGNDDGPSPNTVELAVRAAYPLIVQGRLNADRGTANNDQPDRRTPAEVLEAMRQRPQGILQLGQALRDYAAEVAIRAVGPDGTVLQMSDDRGDRLVTDIYLRNEFSPSGRARAPRPGDTPAHRFDNAVSELGLAMEGLRKAHEAVSKVLGDDGRPLVEAQGVDTRDVREWRDLLGAVEDDLLIWSRKYREVMGKPGTERRDPEVDAPEAQDDPTADWDRDQDQQAAE